MNSTDTAAETADDTQDDRQEPVAEVVEAGVVDLTDDRGMSTIEYALGCVAAAALGALLYLVVTSDAVESALTSIFQRALETE